MILLLDICINDQNNLVVKFEPTDNFDVNNDVEEYLLTANCIKDKNTYVYPNNDLVKFERRIEWFVDYFVKEYGEKNVNLCEKIKEKLHLIHNKTDLFEKAKILGVEIKNKQKHNPNISKSFCRNLMEYQKESVEHMMSLGNAANFSVPGSGKTTITYAAISRWLEDGEVDKIFVIGPTASFLPWEEEYESCFGKKPKSCRVSGDFAKQFHEMGSSYDLFLMHFNSSMNHQWELIEFMKNWKTVLIIDESHYIKSPKLRKWAATALNIAPYAEKRIVLSGTPMPNNAKDLWTQITFLWPTDFPLGNQLTYNDYAKKHGIGKYKQILNKLFCRIKKDDLMLPTPKWHTISVPLNTKQQKIYDFIAAKTLREIDELPIHDQAKLQKFRIAKMIRLCQTASNPTLLHEMSDTFDVNSDTFTEEFGLPCTIDKLPSLNSSIIDQIIHYSDFEIPTKMITASNLAKDLINDGKKVIIWNSFIHNMSIFKNTLLLEFDPIVINGQTTKDPDELENRDKLINRFKNDPDSKVLIASPASLGESVSLHKNSKGEDVCNHAIYLDRNFNGAQYMQSMDRIHRIGMNKNTVVHYHLIIAKNTIDEVINHRLDEKWHDMLDTLQDDMLQSLDINPDPDTIDPTVFDKDYKETVAHLRKVYKQNDSNSL